MLYPSGTYCRRGRADPEAENALYANRETALNFPIVPLLACASVATMDSFLISMGARYTSNSQMGRTSMVPVRAPGI